MQALIYLLTQSVKIEAFPHLQVPVLRFRTVYFKNAANRKLIWEEQTFAYVVNVHTLRLGAENQYLFEVGLYADYVILRP